jgi:hypothetical protein
MSCYAAAHVEHEAQAVEAGDTWIVVEERKGKTPHRLMRDAEALVYMVWLHGLAHQVLRHAEEQAELPRDGATITAPVAWLLGLGAAMTAEGRDWKVRRSAVGAKVEYLK